MEGCPVEERNGNNIDFAITTTSIEDAISRFLEDLPEAVANKVNLTKKEEKDVLSDQKHLNVNCCQTPNGEEQINLPKACEGGLSYDSSSKCQNTIEEKESGIQETDATVRKDLITEVCSGEVKREMPVNTKTEMKYTMDSTESTEVVLSTVDYANIKKYESSIKQMKDGINDHDKCKDHVSDGHHLKTVNEEISKHIVFNEAPTKERTITHRHSMLMSKCIDLDTTYKNLQTVFKNKNIPKTQYVSPDRRKFRGDPRFALEIDFTPSKEVKEDAKINEKRQLQNSKNKKGERKSRKSEKDTKAFLNNKTAICQHTDDIKDVWQFYERVTDFTDYDFNKSYHQIDRPPLSLATNSMENCLDEHVEEFDNISVKLFQEIERPPSVENFYYTNGEAKTTNKHVESLQHKHSPQIYYGTSNPKDNNYPKKPIKTMWAFTKINVYNDASTFEVMETTVRKPRRIPTKTEKVFVVLHDK